MSISTEKESNYQESAGIDPISLYLNEIGGIPLLTWEEVINLGKQIKGGHSAKRKLNQKGIPEEDRSELERQISQGQIAVQELIRHNLRLGVNVAKKYKGKGVPFLDLIQEANLGLYSAAEKFDYAKGYQFSTYATWWIRQKISRFIFDNGSLIRLPIHQVEKFRHIWAVKEKLLENLGREPTNEEWAQKMEISPEKLEKDLVVYESISVVSLDVPVDHGDEEGSEFSHFVSDAAAVDPERAAINTNMREKVEAILSEFTFREQQIIRMRFGIGYDHYFTLEEISNHPDFHRHGHKMTRERIRQLEVKIMRRLRLPTRQERLRGLL